jgi:hypothetical protein
MGGVGFFLSNRNIVIYIIFLQKAFYKLYILLIIRCTVVKEQIISLC